MLTGVAKNGDEAAGEKSKSEIAADNALAEVDPQVGACSWVRVRVCVFLWMTTRLSVQVLTHLLRLEYVRASFFSFFYFHLRNFAVTCVFECVSDGVRLMWDNYRRCCLALSLAEAYAWFRVV